MNAKESEDEKQEAMTKTKKIIKNHLSGKIICVKITLENECYA